MAPPCRLASRLAILDVDQKPAVRVLYGGMRKFKQVTHRSGHCPMRQLDGTAQHERGVLIGLSV